MTVDETLLTDRTGARPVTAGLTEAAARQSSPADPMPNRDIQDELPIAFVPPPVSITRIFPGL